MLLDAFVDNAAPRVAEDSELDEPGVEDDADDEPGVEDDADDELIGGGSSTV